jgi:predicted O-methyltransferase YrrM
MKMVMDVYTLTQNLSGEFQFPNHFRLPPSGSGFDSNNWFQKQKVIPYWEMALRYIKGQPNSVGIEIGSLHGCSAVYCLETILTGKNSKLYCIDVNESEYLKHNLSPYKNVQFIRGFSGDVLRNLKHNNSNKQFADFIYIDGSHLAIHVLEDAVLSWTLLKPYGVLIFDDYGWGRHTDDETLKPKLAIDCFLQCYKNEYVLLATGWQVIVQKIEKCYTYNSSSYQIE